MIYEITRAQWWDREASCGLLPIPQVCDRLCAVTAVSPVASEEARYWLLPHAASNSGCELFKLLPLLLPVALLATETAAGEKRTIDGEMRGAVLFFCGTERVDQSVEWCCVLRACSLCASKTIALPSVSLNTSKPPFAPSIIDKSRSFSSAIEQVAFRASKSLKWLTSSSI